jgi:hypothetical protein
LDTVERARRYGRGKYQLAYSGRNVNEAGREGAGGTIQREQWEGGNSMKKAVTEGKSGDGKRGNGDSCKIIRRYM